MTKAEWLRATDVAARYEIALVRKEYGGDLLAMFDSAYDQGFRSAIEQAAKLVEKYWMGAAYADEIRSLALPKHFDKLNHQAKL
jgi:hypothetical protein